MESGICISERYDEALHKKARDIADSHVGKDVFFRGLIEFSNNCKNDCLYCGIRKGNSTVSRYVMSKDEIMECAKFCSDNNYSSVVLQSGEGFDASFIVDLVKSIKEKYDLRITLCCGEYSKEDYQRFFDSGAERYLLRIETTNKELYSKLHPKEMSFDNRVRCLKNLKEIGFQVGTGVMIGIPGQTQDDLVNDLLFMKEIDVDMVGMGPFIVCDNTPFSDAIIDKEKNLNLSLNMIANLRIMMPTINIAATTALQALDNVGREKAMKAGANVIMPIVTPQKYRANYQLYDDKPCVNETSAECLGCITNRIKSTGLSPAFGKFGDSKHYDDRKR